MHSLSKTLLAFSLLHFVLQGQICLLLHVSLDFLLSALNKLALFSYLLEELLRTHGHKHWPRVPGCDRAGAAGRSYPTSEVRGGGWPGGPTPPPRNSGCAAQECLEELSHVEGQEGRQ